MAASFVDLDEESIQLLPPEAPDGHVVFRKAKISADALGNKRVEFQFESPLLKERLQVTEKAVGSLYAAERIARACYLKFEEGWSKKQVLDFRQDCYDRLRQLQASKSASAAASAAAE
eukprot:3311755-Amphidinium_carterae.1